MKRKEGSEEERQGERNLGFKIFWKRKFVTENEPEFRNTGEATARGGGACGDGGTEKRRAL